MAGKAVNKVAINNQAVIDSNESLYSEYATAGKIVLGVEH